LPKDPAAGRHHHRKPTFGWKIQRFLIASSKKHAFLDRSWVSLLFKSCPRRKRRHLALHLLSLSPHYWIYQWSKKYPPHFSRNDVLEAEFKRNSESRRYLCELVLKQFLNEGMDVLDFGCGPGFLARWTSKRVHRVVASDVSRGVIECARQLNPAENLEYTANGVSDLKYIPDASLDLVYSFAVFQHLRKAQTQEFLEEFARVLRPGGKGVCHTILKDAGEAGEFDPKGWIEKRVMLRMVYYSSEEWRHMLEKAGMENIAIRDVSSYADIDDDIGSEQLVTFQRPAA
jgi:ubiquinone/menaquinone biosynthesis C-methylase UbiE